MLKYLIILLMSLALHAQSDYKQEINHLLSFVKNTPCVYIRNGDAHSGEEAVKHIQRKYDYYKDDIASAEDFIRLSATKSTMSGSKYYVQCGNKPKIESSRWLLAELQHYRNTHD